MGVFFEAKLVMRSILVNPGNRRRHCEPTPKAWAKQSVTSS
jgi:hypothetical protein